MWSNIKFHTALLQSTKKKKKTNYPQTDLMVSRQQAINSLKHVITILNGQHWHKLSPPSQKQKHFQLSTFSISKNQTKLTEFYNNQIKGEKKKKKKPKKKSETHWVKEPQRKTLFPPCLQTNRIGINTVPGTAASSGTEFMFGEYIYPWISKQFTKKCPYKKSTFFFFFFFFLLLLFFVLTHSSLYLFTITKPPKKNQSKFAAIQYNPAQNPITKP